MRLFTLFLVVCFLDLVAASTSDVCANYVNLTDYRRSTNYIQPPSSSSWLCDVSLSPSTWYRFASRVGGTIPTACVDIFTCGTHDPIWINGTHPTEADGVVSRQVCASEDEEDCCGWTDTIEIKNCGDYYVYKLAVPTRCYYAYCAGNGTICDGDSTDNDCVDPYPVMTDDPTLEGPMINHEKGEFYFICTVQFKESRQGVKFEVQWLFDHTSDPTLMSSIIEDGSLSIELHSPNMSFDNSRLGKPITCRARAFTDNSDRSPWKYSNGYFAGIRLVSDSTTIILEENAGPQTITLESTVPIICRNRFSCHLTLYPSNNDDIALRDIEDCSITIDQDDWNESTSSAQKTYSVIALRDNVLDGNKNLITSFVPVENQDNEDLHIWNNYVVGGKSVRTIDKDSKQCRSYGYSHYRTFDEHTFDYAGVGEYILMKSKIRNFEVQSRVTECGKHGRTSCNCGMAVKENNDVIVIDYCAAIKTGEVSSTDMAPKIKIRCKELSNGTSLRMGSQGNVFYVYLYSGAWVKVHLYDWGIDIVVHAPSDDYGETSGLCGVFDSNPNNDFTKSDGSSIPITSEPVDFADSWRVPQGDNLFLDEIDGDSGIESVTSCRCYGGDVTSNSCGYRSHVTNQEEHGNDVSDFFLATNKSDVVSVGLDLLTDDFDFTWNSDFRAVVSDWPTESGITRETAIATCTQALENTEFAAGCSSSTDVDKDDIISDCVFDIKISDDSSVAISSINTYQDICGEVAVRDKTVTNPTTITLNTCTNGCNSLGTCVNNDCRCNAGYVGEDCSIAENQTPSILGLRWNGACDVATHPCEYVFVIGNGFLNTETLKCKISTGESNERTERSILVSFREAACPLKKILTEPALTGRPHLQNYEISISNDGSTYTATMPFVIYNSVCMDCEDASSCKKKVNSCLVLGVCYAAGQLHPNNTAFICSPALDEYGWSSVGATGNKDKSGAVIGAVCALIIIAVVVTVGLVVWSKKRAKELARNTSDDRTINQQYGHFKNDSTPSLTVEVAK